MQHISVSYHQNFQQPNEKSLVPTQMHAIDSCNSQKHDKIAGLCNDHVFESKYFLLHSFMNGFKNKVKSHAAAYRAEKDASNVTELENGFVVPKDKLDNHCRNN